MFAIIIIMVTGIKLELIKRIPRVPVLQIIEQAHSVHSRGTVVGVVNRRDE